MTEKRGSRAKKAAPEKPRAKRAKPSEPEIVGKEYLDNYHDHWRELDTKFKKYIRGNSDGKFWQSRTLKQITDMAASHIDRYGEAPYGADMVWFTPGSDVKPDMWNLQDHKEAYLPVLNRPSLPFEYTEKPDPIVDLLKESWFNRIKEWFGL